MIPEQAIQQDPPNVWLKSFYRFRPDTWGFVGFIQESTRHSFLSRSEPGVLVVIYVALGRGVLDERGMVVGLLQIGSKVGDARDFMPPDAWHIKQSDPDQSDKWNFAVQAERAWKVTPETRQNVEDFAPITYNRDRSQTIGAQGMQLQIAEAKNILRMDLIETPVFGGPPVENVLGGAERVLRPSLPGPVSTLPYFSREAEGLKHLYILQLQGNIDHFLGQDTRGQQVVKVGFSRSPATRCDDHNRALPSCAFKWSIAFSTFNEGLIPFSSSTAAKAGEHFMKDFLQNHSQSLGGEFFLAPAEKIRLAWELGKSEAEKKR